MSELIEIERNCLSTRKLLIRIEEQLKEQPSNEQIDRLIALASHTLTCVEEIRKSINLKRESKI
jgi:hypothetical protein